MPKNLNTERLTRNTTKVHLSDDLLFLIACCQTDPSEDLALNVDTPVVKTKEGCNALIGLANQHGILPLVYKSIKEIVESDSPRSSPNTQHVARNTLLLELKTHYMSIVQRNMLMSAELIKIIKLLKENHIEALAFKGPTLAQMAYGDITLRQYVDLDILVEESDAYRAGKLMSENGHTPVLPLTILDNKTCLDTAKDFSLLSESGGVHTELHWRLFEKKYNISILSCASQEKCQVVSINGKKFRTLQNELLLVYLCLHGAKHAFERIEWICDIDRLIRSSKIKWQETIDIAGRSHSNRSFYLGLSLAYHLFSTSLPGDILQRIALEDIVTLETMTLKRLSQDHSVKSDFEKSRDTFFYQSKLFDRKSDMLRFRLATFFKISTTDCQTFILPEYLKFLYLFLRPIRLVFSYIKRFLGA